MTEQVEVEVLDGAGARVHGLVKVPLPLLPKLTLPVGLLVGGPSVSVTVAVQVVGVLTLTAAGEQLTDVKVLLSVVTASAKVPLLGAWVASPP